jgi:hypothetical protein
VRLPAVSIAAPLTVRLPPARFTDAGVIAAPLGRIVPPAVSRRMPLIVNPVAFVSEKSMPREVTSPVLEKLAPVAGCVKVPFVML